VGSTYYLPRGRCECRPAGPCGDEGLDRAGPRARAAGGSEMKTLGCQARDQNCLSWIRSGRHFKFEPGVATGSRCSTGKDPSERGPVVVGPVRVGVRLGARCGPGSVARQRLGGQSIPSQPMISCRSRAARGRCSHAGSGDVCRSRARRPGRWVAPSGPAVHSLAEWRWEVRPQ
jgi:hypothetical protein